MTVEFQLDGLDFVDLNGGPQTKAKIDIKALQQAYEGQLSIM